MHCQRSMLHPIMKRHTLALEGLYDLVRGLIMLLMSMCVATEEGMRMRVGTAILMCMRMRIVVFMLVCMLVRRSFCLVHRGPPLAEFCRCACRRHCSMQH